MSDINKQLSYLLFPGIIIHELAHAVACLSLGVEIKKMKWLGASGGFVIHENTRSSNIIIISLFPFVLNILLAIACGYIFNRYDTSVLGKILIAWIGVSAIFFSQPSSQDANNVISAIKSSYTKSQSIWRWLYKIILLPFALIALILAIIFKMLDNSMLLRIIMIIFWAYLFMIKF
jgi:hypothetical protein